MCSDRQNAELTRDQRTDIVCISTFLITVVANVIWIKYVHEGIWTFYNENMSAKLYLHVNSKLTIVDSEAHDRHTVECKFSKLGVKVTLRTCLCLSHHA